MPIDDIIVNLYSNNWYKGKRCSVLTYDLNSFFIHVHRAYTVTQNNQNGVEYFTR